MTSTSGQDRNHSELRGEKILVTGVAGTVALPLATRLARTNDVWGLDLFDGSRGAGRETVEAAGITTCQVDLTEPDYRAVPDDFTYVLHFAAYLRPGEDYDAALRVDAEGTGLLLAHVRAAKAALVVSSASVYERHPDPWHPFTETDPLGAEHLQPLVTYGISKNAEEAVARACARILNLPVVIGRLCAPYGLGGGLPVMHLAAVAAGEEIVVRHDPQPYSILHTDDLARFLGPLLASASVPATVVNLGGDEAVTTQQWCAYAAELLGQEARLTVQPQPDAKLGVVCDPTRRRALTGPSLVPWKEGLRAVAHHHFPDRVGDR